MAIPYRQLLKLAPLISLPVHVDLLATQHQCTAFHSRHLLLVPKMPMRILSLLLPDSSSPPLLMALFASGHLKRGLA